MLKVLLCDDDQIILTGLEQLTPWSELGLEVVGCANDGLTAKELFDAHNPEIIISDVNMPFFSGLELLQYIKGKNPHTQVIMISGYDEFSYVQSALKKGANDYILKPVDQDALIEQLEKSIANYKKNTLHKKLLDENMRNVQSKLIRNYILNGSEANTGITSINQGHCLVTIAVIDNYNYLKHHLSSEDLSKVNNAFYQSINSSTFSGCEIYEQKDGVCTFYLYAKDAFILQKRFDVFAHNLRLRFKKSLPDGTITFVCGKSYDNIKKLRSSYLEANEALNEVFVNPCSSTIIYNNDMQQKDTWNIDNMLKDVDFIPLIKQLDNQGVLNELQRLKEMLLKCGAQSLLYMRVIVTNLFSSLIKSLSELDSDLFSDMDLVSEYQYALECQTIDEAIDHLGDILTNIMSVMEKAYSGKNSKLIQKAINYIEKNHMNSELNMEQVAASIHMSPSYFSVIFKAETGYTFTDYLIKTRIDRAIEYMRNPNLKMYEISYNVGYDSAAYFSAAFKKIMGLSPSEYKKSLEI